MAKTTRKKTRSAPTVVSSPGLAERLASFVAERFPFAVEGVMQGLGGSLQVGDDRETLAAHLDGLRKALPKKLSSLSMNVPQGTPETTPRVSAKIRLEQARREIVEAVDGFFQREAIAASLTPDERREILRGMVLTRATDNQLKAFFLGGNVRYGSAAFQGKGFRSLGQEAIYAAPLRLRRGAAYRRDDGTWEGDIVAPLIRDLGAALAMHPAPETVQMVLSAQMGKAGPPMNGRDLHIGDLSWGILPAAAPLAISSLTVSGLALAFSRQGHPPSGSLPAASHRQYDARTPIPVLPFQREDVADRDINDIDRRSQDVVVVSHTPATQSIRSFVSAVVIRVADHGNLKLIGK